ncbi:DNA cytosine methyltransferase [Spirosoma foliorum]|uniref:Cytosine-specific methyltransferase n=1 Tax=Spirosoma foliorum TaxID=2710596 RepID=A0A7G5H2M4_9BACT|nr:DNA cytosine methyltransferase [Spirosoma foliorum]QMW05366.1 DNA cytosine methyltransferase [Spirosoma foliorum]
MILLDLFSGIHGFEKGLSDAGLPITEHYYSEIDKDAIAISKYNFPHAHELGTVSAISGQKIPRPNLITFGSPCQDFSLAGDGAGMAGNKSVLIRHAIRLISETRPDVFIWENVKGVITSRHRKDFWAIVQAFANIGGYRLEWQLLDTAWVLPQDRERIYLIGHLDGRSRPGVFPFREGEVGTSEGAAKAASVRALTGGGKPGGHHSGMTLVRQINTTNKESGGQQPYQQNRVYDINGLAPSLSSQCMGRGPAIVTKARGFNQGRSSATCGTISSHSFEQNHFVSLLDGDIRRLTEIECERLHGYPDDWTKYGIYDGVIKQVAKTNRYRLLGNTVTRDIVELIGSRLKNCLF